MGLAGKHLGSSWHGGQPLASGHGCSPAHLQQMKGKIDEMQLEYLLDERSGNSPHCRELCTALKDRDPRLEPEQTHLRKNLLPQLAGRLRPPQPGWKLDQSYGACHCHQGARWHIAAPVLVSMGYTPFRAGVDSLQFLFCWLLDPSSCLTQPYSLVPPRQPSAAP